MMVNLWSMLLFAKVFWTAVVMQLPGGSLLAKVNSPKTLWYSGLFKVNLGSFHHAKIAFQIT